MWKYALQLTCEISYLKIFPGVIYPDPLGGGGDSLSPSARSKTVRSSALRPQLCSHTWASPLLAPNSVAPEPPLVMKISGNFPSLTAADGKLTIYNQGLNCQKISGGIDICLFIVTVITHRQFSIINNGGGLKLTPRGIPGHLVGGGLSKQLGGGSTPQPPPPGNSNTVYN
jgi:hypothetical protein